MGSPGQQEVMDREQNCTGHGAIGPPLLKGKRDEKERTREAEKKVFVEVEKKWKNVMCLKSIDGNVSRRK